MTTAKPNSLTKTSVSKGQIAKWTAAGLLALLALLLALNFSTLQGFARLGSSYAAHVTCSCRYIEGRDMASCANDTEPGMELVSIHDNTETRRITASVPFLAKAMAERRGEFGCQQLSKDEMAALD
jgi:hypothetical protein